MNKKRNNGSIKNIWIITREYGRLAGVGGVKDVSRQLAAALAGSGRKVSVVLPLYGFMDPAELGLLPLDISFFVDMNYVTRERREPVRIWSLRHDASIHPACGNGLPGPASKKRGGGKKAVTIYFIDSPRFGDKKRVYTYTLKEEDENPDHSHGTGHHDYFAMNILLQKAALGLMVHLSEKPDIIHCQDGHTAVLPAMMREIEGYRHYFRKSGAVVTIHNAGRGYHQDMGDHAFARAICGLPSRTITDNLLDGMFNPFLTASSYAVLNTVSENYARELTETNDDEMTGWLGHRLVARGFSLQGITNGIDPDHFDLSSPEKLGLPKGSALPVSQGTVSSGQAGRKKKVQNKDFYLPDKNRCREFLVNIIGDNELGGIKKNGSLDLHLDQPLFTWIGRFTPQKGMDILVRALEVLLSQDRDFQVVLLGTGTTDIEQDLLRLTENHENSGRICMLRGFDSVLANRIYAAGDFCLIPSQYEPCGLTDFIAQLFGNIPIVHHIGGLVKVVDNETGFAYQEHSSQALISAMQNGMSLFRNFPERIAEIQLNALKQIHTHYTWDIVMDKYLDLYKEALALTA
ncbi:MAG: glycogen/starch synthase [Desulfobulbaceae bacterium]|nr:glycogen/starch synthase [Desulfobulbaceae bacterium]